MRFPQLQSQYVVQMRRKALEARLVAHEPMNVNQVQRALIPPILFIAVDGWVEGLLGGRTWVAGDGVSPPWGLRVRGIRM